MKQAAYEMTQEQLVILAQLINPLPLVEFLDAIDRAETLGPILDPTLFHKAGRRLEQVKALAHAARTFQIEVHRQMAEILEAK